MVANIETLKEVLIELATAHKAEFKDWSEEDGQFGVSSDTVPTVADMRMVANAFFGNDKCVETSWGYTVIYLDYDFLPKVNTNPLMFAIPRQAYNKIIKKYGK